MRSEEILTVAMFIGSHYLILRDEARDSSSRLTHGTGFLLSTFNQVPILDVKKFMLDLPLMFTHLFTLQFLLLLLFLLHLRMSRGSTLLLVLDDCPGKLVKVPILLF